MAGRSLEPFSLDPQETAVFQPLGHPAAKAIEKLALSIAEDPPGR
jgi:hypothetical protein